MSVTLDEVLECPPSHPLYSLFIPPVFPYSLTYTAPCLVSTHIYLVSLTFSLGPDEVATVRWLQKLVCDLNAIYFVSAIKGVLLIWIQTKVVTYLSTHLNIPNLSEIAMTWRKCLNILKNALHRSYKQKLYRNVSRTKRVLTKIHFCMLSNFQH